MHRQQGVPSCSHHSRGWDGAGSRWHEGCSHHGLRLGAGLHAPCTWETRTSAAPCGGAAAPRAHRPAAQHHPLFMTELFVVQKGPSATLIKNPMSNEYAKRQRLLRGRDLSNCPYFIQIKTNPKRARN